MTTPSKKDGLVGLFGHEMGTGERSDRWNMQFEVLGKITDDLYRVQMFSAIDGCETGQELWSLARLTPCRFYTDEETWKTTGNRMWENWGDREFAKREAVRIAEWQRSQTEAS